MPKSSLRLVQLLAAVATVTASLPLAATAQAGRDTPVSAPGAPLPDPKAGVNSDHGRLIAITGPSAGSVSGTVTMPSKH